MEYHRGSANAEGVVSGQRDLTPVPAAQVQECVRIRLVLLDIEATPPLWMCDGKWVAV